MTPERVFLSGCALVFLNSEEGYTPQKRDEQFTPDPKGNWYKENGHWHYHNRAYDIEGKEWFACKPLPWEDMVARDCIALADALIRILEKE